MIKTIVGADPFRLLTKGEIYRIKKLNPELTDFLNDVEEIMELEDSVKGLELAIDLFKQYKDEKDFEGFRSYVSSLLVIYMLVKAVEKKSIISRQLGFYPDFDSILLAILKLIEKDEDSALIPIEKIKNSVFGSFFTNELLAEPAFIAILYLIELYTGKPSSSIKALSTYIKMESDRERVELIVSLTLNKLLKRIKIDGNLRDEFDLAYTLTFGLPSEEIIKAINIVLLDAVEKLDSLDDNFILSLINIVAQMRAIIGEVHIDGKVIELIKKSKSELKEFLLRLIEGDTPDINDAPPSYLYDLVIPLAILGKDVSDIIVSSLDAYTVIKSLEFTLRKVLEVNAKRAISILDVMIKIAKAHWTRIEAQTILSIYRLLLLASGLYDKSLILRYPNIFIRGFILSRYYESELFQRASFALLLKSLSYFDDVEKLKVFSEATYGLKNKEIEALKIFINARIKMLSGDIDNALELFEKVEKMAEDLDDILYCYFMLEINRNYLKMGMYERVDESLKYLKCPLYETLGRDIEYTRLSLLVEAYLAMSRFEEAEMMLNELEEMLRKEARNQIIFSEGISEILATRAKIELMRGNYESALELINQAISIVSDYGIKLKEYELLRANILAKLGEKDEIMDTLKNIIESEYDARMKANALLILINADPKWVDLSIKFVEKSIEEGKINDVRRLLYFMLNRLIDRDKNFIKLCRILPIIEKNLNHIVNIRMRDVISSQIEIAKTICNE